MTDIKIKTDWYQTETHVVVSVLAKNVDKTQTNIEFSDKDVKIKTVLSNGENYNKTFNLLHEISPNNCSYTIHTSKIEIKLKKVEGLRWNVLERPADKEEEPALPSKMASLPSSENPPRYPSSSKHAVDWDNVKYEEEKEEGEAAVNNLFQQIYSQGTDEVRKAMNKSFVESGGTVLSTNWNEVKEKPVEIKPGDGQEFKKWDS